VPQTTKTPKGYCVDNKQEKSDLLSQLTIDRTVEASEGWSTSYVMGFGVVCLIVGATLVYFLMSSNTGDEGDLPVQASAQHAPSVKQQEAEQTPASAAKRQTSVPQGEAVLNASGYITARLVATVSAETLGLISEVNVEEGMQVSKGQVLATLDDSIAQVNLALAKAQVDVLDSRRNSLTADLNEARRVLRRLSSLKNEDFSSEADLTRAKTALEKSQSSIAGIQADIHVAKLEVARQQELFDNHTIRAPFDGVVTVKNA